MAKDERRDNRADRRGGRKEGRRKNRRKERQSTKQGRVGALDRMVANGGMGDRSNLPPDVQARFDQAQAKMAQTGFQSATGGGRTGPPQIGPPETGPPQIGPPMPPEQVGGVAIQQGLRPAEQPAERVPTVAPPQPVPPQPVPPQIGPPMPPQPATEPAPVMGPPMPPEVQVDPVGGMVPQPIDPATGAPLLGPPATPEEAQAQADMDAASAAGQTFNIQPPAVAPPEQFYNNQLGQGGMQNPRDLERIRRKRLALLNPQVQQLRPQGRGMPQIRYQGGPAFPGAFQLPPNAGFNGLQQG